MKLFTRLIGTALGLLNALLLWRGYPILPAGQKLNMSKFELTWSDEFEGDSLDPDKWNGHGFESGEFVKRRDGYWAMEAARVKDGALRIPSFYSEEGLAGGPPGYYSLGIDTSKAFRQIYGYFEVRCVVPKGLGLWSAFWLYNEDIGKPDTTPQMGTEVDIYESQSYYKGGAKKNAVSSVLHYYEGGYQGTLRSKLIGEFCVRSPYKQFHTYGLEWNEKEYIFYIDGKVSGRSSFGGVCREALWPILSVEHIFGNRNWVGDIRNNPPGGMTDFVIDYVRVYQYKELL